MKQIGMAVQMYCQDWDETYPFLGCWGCGSGSDANNPMCSTQAKIYPYVKNLGVYDCPSADMYKLTGVWNGCARVGSWGWPFPPDWVGTSIDIGYNDQMNKKSMASMPTPAETVVFSDAAYFLSCGGTRTVYANTCCAACAPCTSVKRTRNNTRHVEGENLVFADGHAKWMNHREIADKCGKLFHPQDGLDQRTGKYFWSESFWDVWGGGPAD